MLWSEGYPGTICNIASMTSEQGRLGAYADAKTIKDFAPAVYGDIEVLSSPREFRMANGSRMHFNQYSNSETAKGIACDWLFVNEANNFTKQQYTDLKANARLGTFIDYNPNCEFWDVDFFTDADICDTTWQDNPYLTAAQLEYFADLKRLAESPTATEIDRRNYSVYYLGRYYQLNGDIFSEDFFNWSSSVDYGSVGHFAVFCDPSALRGSDWFACCLTARDNEGRVYVIDTYSVNTGDRAGIVRKLREWCKTYDVAKVYVETNGIIGIDFYDFAVNSELNVEGWYSRGGKFDRIIANYQNFRERMTILDTPANREYMKQTYSFAERMRIGEHDDNIDALNSSYNMQTMVV